MNTLLTNPLHFPSPTIKGKVVKQIKPRYFYSGISVRVNLPNTPPTPTSTPTTSARRPRSRGQRRSFPVAAAQNDQGIPSIFMASSAAAADGADHHLNPEKDDRIQRIASAIRVIPDFPKPGILFQDITTLLLDPQAFKDTIDLFVERYRDKSINVVAGENISQLYSFVHLCLFISFAHDNYQFLVLGFRNVA